MRRTRPLPSCAEPRRGEALAPSPSLGQGAPGGGGTTGPTLLSVQPLDLQALAQQLELPDEATDTLLHAVDRWPETPLTPLPPTPTPSPLPLPSVNRTSKRSPTCSSSTTPESPSSSSTPSPTPPPLKLWSSLRRLWDAFVPTASPQTTPPSSPSKPPPTHHPSTSTTRVFPDQLHTPRHTTLVPDREVRPLAFPLLPPLTLPPSPPGAHTGMSARPVSDQFEDILDETDLSPAARPSDDDLYNLQSISSPPLLMTTPRRNSAPLLPASKTSHTHSSAPFRKRFSFLPTRHHPPAPSPSSASTAYHRPLSQPHAPSHHSIPYASPSPTLSPCPPSPPWSSSSVALDDPSSFYDFPQSSIPSPPPTTPQPQPLPTRRSTFHHHPHHHPQRPQQFPSSHPHPHSHHHHTSLRPHTPRTPRTNPNPPPRAATHSASFSQTPHFPSFQSSLPTHRDTPLDRRIAQLQTLQAQLRTQHLHPSPTTPPPPSPSPQSPQNSFARTRSAKELGALDALSERRRHVLVSQQKRLASSMRVSKVGDVPRNVRLPVHRPHPNQVLPIDSSLFV